MSSLLDYIDDPILCRSISSRLARQFILGLYGETRLFFNAPPDVLLHEPDVPEPTHPSYVFQYRAWLQRKLRQSGLCYLIPAGTALLPEINCKVHPVGSILSQRLQPTSFYELANYYLLYLDYIVEPEKLPSWYASIVRTITSIGVFLVLIAMYIFFVSGLVLNLPITLAIFCVLVLLVVTACTFGLIIWRQDCRRIVFLTYCIRAFGELSDEDTDPREDPRIIELQLLTNRHRETWLEL